MLIFPLQIQKKWISPKFEWWYLRAFKTKMILAYQFVKYVKCYQLTKKEW